MRCATSRLEDGGLQVGLASQRALEALREISLTKESPEASRRNGLKSTEQTAQTADAIQ